MNISSREFFVKNAIFVHVLINCIALASDFTCAITKVSREQ